MRRKTNWSTIPHRFIIISCLNIFHFWTQKLLSYRRGQWRILVAIVTPKKYPDSTSYLVFIIWDFPTEPSSYQQLKQVGTTTGHRSCSIYERSMENLDLNRFSQKYLDSTTYLVFLIRHHPTEPSITFPPHPTVPTPFSGGRNRF